MLVLPRGVLHRLRADARAAAPAECCGLLIGRDAAGARVVHAYERVANDRTHRYAIPAARFAACERQARASGNYVCGVYHSHPTGRAQPGARDLELGWPGFDYMIIDAIGDVRAWRLTDDRQAFIEIPIHATAA